MLLATHLFLLIAAKTDVAGWRMAQKTTKASTSTKTRACTLRAAHIAAHWLVPRSGAEEKGRGGACPARGAPSATEGAGGQAGGQRELRRGSSRGEGVSRGGSRGPPPPPLPPPSAAPSPLCTTTPGPRPPTATLHSAPPVALASQVSALRPLEPPQFRSSVAARGGGVTRGGSGAAAGQCAGREQQGAAAECRGRGGGGSSRPWRVQGLGPGDRPGPQRRKRRAAGERLRLQAEGGGIRQAGWMGGVRGGRGGSG